MAGASNTGQLHASRMVLKRSSATPPAILPIIFAVAGAIITISIERRELALLTMVLVPVESGDLDPQYSLVSFLLFLSQHYLLDRVASSPIRLSILSHIHACEW